MNGDRETKNLRIEGMHCASCVGRVEKALGRVEGVGSVAVNLATEKAAIELERGVDDAVLIEAVRDAGFDAAPLDDAAADLEAQAQQERVSAARAKRRAFVAVVLGGAVMSLSMGPMLVATWPVDEAVAHGLAWILTTIVVFGAGRGFFTGAWSQLRHGNSDMNTLVALGTGSAWLYSTVAITAPGWLTVDGVPPKAYFDSAALIVAFLLVGRALEARARYRTGDALRSLLDRNAPTATVLRDGVEVEVDAKSLREGDQLVVRPGETVPVDGVVVEGRSAVDESMLTGESVPVPREAPMRVFAGTISTDGRIVVRASSVGDDTVFARIVRMVEHAQSSKAPIQRVADRIASIFVPIVIVIAIVAFATWMVVTGGHFDRALLHFVTVLIIACPCAMGLATPAAILVGSGRGAERGILVRDGAVFEELARVDTVIFDKTGTLTEGRPEVMDFGARAIDASTLLVASATIESGSEHPLGRAVVEFARRQGATVEDTTEIRAVAGRGIEARLEGATWRMGSARWFGELGLDTADLASAITEQERQGRTVLFVARDDTVVGWFALADRIRASARDTVEQLHAMNVRVALLTGDREAVAQRVAEQLGIDAVHAEVLPEQKAEVVRAAKAEGRCVAMVGDGINDAVALAEANVGIAMGGGTDVAVEAGSVVLLRDDPLDVLRALRLGRSTVRAIRQNLFWAFAYNTLGIPVAAGVFAPLGIVLHPALGAAAMALSSISVLANSLRLRRAI